MVASLSIGREVKVYTPLRLFWGYLLSIISHIWFFTDDSFQITEVNYFIGCMSSCELFCSLKCHTSPLPNPWRSRGRETFEFRAFYDVWWRHLLIYVFCVNFALYVCKLEPGTWTLQGNEKQFELAGNSSYRGNFQWKFDQGKGNLVRVLEH